MDNGVLLMLAGALISGLGLGWFFGSRPLALLREEKNGLGAELREAVERRSAMSEQLAAAQERARQSDELRLKLDRTEQERNNVLHRLASLESEQQVRAQAMEEQLAQLHAARDQLSAQFSEIGGKLLSQVQRDFLERAEQRFGQQQEKSEAQLKALLNPIGDSIRQYDRRIGEIEQKRTEHYGELKGLMDSMRAGQESVRDEAQRLVNSLRAAPKTRGRWGEQQLRNVLEQCGLSEHADFRTEVSVESADGRLRPDVVINIPGGRTLVVDAKVSLNSYQDAFSAGTDAERQAHLARHAAAMKAHVDGLSRKAYHDQFAETADYVIMFVPGEHFLSAALEQDSGLWDYAFTRQVLMATPTNLIAIARTVAATWRQEKMAEEAKRIGALGKELYERLANAATLLRRLGGRLNGAVEDYNKFASSFESRLLVTGRKMRDLNVETGGKDLEMLEPVEALTREPSSPEAQAAAEEPALRLERS